MPKTIEHFLIIALLLGPALAITPAAAQMTETRIGPLEFAAGYPTDEAAQKLFDELDFQRAVQTYLWAMPLSSYGAFAEEHFRLGANNNTVMIAEQSAKQHHLVLTGNQDTVYLSGVLDLRDGTVVLELPRGLLGTMNNLWQEPLVDLGGPFSPEQNKGGRFLILPPGYDQAFPRFHHHLVNADTNIVGFYVRAIGQSRADWTELSESMKEFKV
jgi:hypothetical protein